MIAEKKTELVNQLRISEYSKNLYAVATSYLESNWQLEYYRIQAEKVQADYFYCFSQLDRDIAPFIYVYDRKKESSINNSAHLSSINKKLWTLGEVALAVIIYCDEIVILDTRYPISIEEDKEKASIFLETKEIDDDLKKKIFGGQILEDSSINYGSVSPYQLLLNHIQEKILDKESKIGCDKTLLRKILVKFILIKYLEEQKDDDNESVFRSDFFSKYIDTYISNPTFCDVLHFGNVCELLKDLHSKYNGGIFELTKEEEDQLGKTDLSVIAYALDGRMDKTGQIQFPLWRYYDFNLLPIEFISRLYECFVISADSEAQKKRGAYYTPPHLARLLVDELLPFDKNIDFGNFKVLDPTCGSGVFLVLAYKRLITIWLLSKGKMDVKGLADITCLKKILRNCIYGVDINEDALSITATSLQIELCSHLNPKEIWESLTFDNLVGQGNLTNVGFFKWYKDSDLRFDVILGNPPFNISKEDNQKDVNIGLDDDYTQEFYENRQMKKINFPLKNPALIILYKSLERLLKDDSAELMMIMPSSSFLYMPTSSKYRMDIANKWNICKIYDFTPLRKHLWGRTNIATIAVKINRQKSDFIEHIIVRNSTVNEKGAMKFVIDKYDRFKVYTDYLFSKDVSKRNIWKINLLGGGRLEFFVEGLALYPQLKTFFKLFNIDSETGFQTDNDFLNNPENEYSPRRKNLKGENVIDANLFTSDEYSKRMIKDISKDCFVRIPEKVQEPPNVLLRLSCNHNSIMLNESRNLFFPKGVLGIKGNNLKLLKLFWEVYKENRPIYTMLAKIFSAQAYTTQEGAYTINKREVLDFPINLDENNLPIPFNQFSHIERAIVEDTDMISTLITSSSGRLFDRVSTKELEEYGKALCEILNIIYEHDSYRFTITRQIKSEDIIWLTIKHTNESPYIEKEITKNNNELLKSLIEEAESCNGAITINRIITSYQERNCISLIKPNKLKYWMRTVAYKDAENVKGQMFSKGY